MAKRPFSVDRILASSRRLEAARKAVVEEDAGHTRRRLQLVQRVRAAEEELARAATEAQGAMSSEEAQEPAAVEGPAHWPSLTQEGVPISWRVAFQLLRDSCLDHKKVGGVLWPGAPPGVARNRLNAILMRLKQLGVVSPLGKGIFHVDMNRLAELSPVSPDAPQDLPLTGQPSQGSLVAGHTSP